MFNFLSVARRVTKRIVVVHADKSAQGESKIVDDYNIDSIFLAPFGGIRLTYIPKYVKYFKSFDPPVLPDFTGEPLPTIDMLHPEKMLSFDWEKYGLKLKEEKVNVRDVLKKWRKK